MSLSKLAEECKKCKYVDTCEHKRMEAVGFLPGEPTLEETMKLPKGNIAVMGMGGTGLNASLLYPSISEPIKHGMQSESRKLTDEKYKQMVTNLVVAGVLLGGHNGKE